MSKVKWTLSCHKCGRQMETTEHDAERYSAIGWPKCCNITMELRTHEADSESSHDL